MITSGTRLSPLSLLIGGYYLNKCQSQPYSHMPYINHGYRSESKSYVFSCISCCNPKCVYFFSCSNKKNGY